MKPPEQYRMRQKLRPMKHPEQPMKQKLQTAAMQEKVKPEHRRMMPAIPPQTKQKPDPMKTPEQPMMTQRLRLMTAVKQRMIRRMQRLMIPAHLQRITDRMQEHLQKTMTVRIIPMTMRIPVKSLTVQKSPTAVLNSRIRLIHQISPTTHRIRTAVPMIRQMTAQKKLQKLI